MEIKEKISAFLLSNDTLRFKVQGIDYYFSQGDNLCVIENLTRDVYRKFLELAKSNNWTISSDRAYDKKPDIFSPSNMTVFYSVTFEVN